jgi:thiol-disulfide isomerase/thioredoxin
MKIFDIENYTDFENFFNNNINEFIIINISASWCKPCNEIKKNLLNFINNINNNNSIFLRIEYDLIENDENFMKFFEINKIPYFYIYKNKSKINEFQNSNIEFIKNEINSELLKNDNIPFNLTNDF